MDEEFLNTWKSRGTMMRVSGRWAIRVESTWKDHMDQWIWIDLKGKKGKPIKVISAYQVSQRYLKDPGATTPCQHQARSMIKRGIINPNPKSPCLTDLMVFINNWRIQGTNHDVVIMADMNTYICEQKELYDFCY